MPRLKITASEIEEFYENGDSRLNQDRNDFLLPQIRDFVKNLQWLNLRPEYQRRLVWDRKKKSLLIESLLMNVPIPPVFLYEIELNRYEVMDGQQRLNAIMEFYENGFALTGLTTWSVLNGLTYKKCPPIIQRGLDRRKISATILVAENSRTGRYKEIREQVFERLNTGGLGLNAQELRNSLYSGPFNDLLIELAGNRTFNEIWQIPAYSDNYRKPDYISPQLASNKLFRRMTDCEIVLRFFAFSRTSKLRGSVRKMLDECMTAFQYASGHEIDLMRDKFTSTLETAFLIFKDRTFKFEDSGKWKVSQAIYDAQMVALSEIPDRWNNLIDQSFTVRKIFQKEMKDPEAHKLLVGNPNTAKSIRDRIDLAKSLFLKCV